MKEMKMKMKKIMKDRKGKRKAWKESIKYYLCTVTFYNNYLEFIERNHQVIRNAFNLFHKL